MNEYIGKKVLITTAGWFYGPDGKNYRGVFGTLKGIHEVGKKFGFIPNRAHANWFIEIGSMTIMGCQVMYCNLVDSINTGEVTEYKILESTMEVKLLTRPSDIYVTN